MSVRSITRTDLWLRVTAGACALTSLAALVAHVAGALPMVFFLTFFGVPSVVLLLALAAHARRLNASAFLAALAVGVAGGLVATLAYDGFRFILRELGVFKYDGFRAIYIFGGWIAGRGVTTMEAAVAGWIYHFWNGISFGVFYTLTFGNRHWLYGVGYGLFMEACMLGLFPLFVRITNRFDFIALSLLGHTVYGAVLGTVAQRYAQRW
jgi:hypothetical protein